MSYIDAKNKINDIKEATTSFESEVNKVQSQLMELSTEISSVAGTINSDLHEETIAGYSQTAANEANKKINVALAKSNGALSGLSVDATDEIKRIVDAHNNSIDPEAENPEPRLSYETISLSSVAGCPTDIDDSSDKQLAPPTGSSGKDKDLDYYLSKLSSKGFSSKKINGWNSCVNSFLKEYKLDKTIKDIEVDDKTVKCILADGKEYSFNNITSTLDLLKALESAIANEK